MLLFSFPYCELALALEAFELPIFVLIYPTWFIVIHTVEGFGIVNKAEIDVFLELSCFFDDPVDVGNLIISRVHHEKCWAGRSTGWNQDCGEKYQ